MKVANAGGSATYAAIANGIVLAAQHGARAMNVSIGGAGYSQTLCDAVTAALNAGTLVVASAGNNASFAPNYPAACPGAVDVAATDSSDSPAGFSGTCTGCTWSSAYGYGRINAYRALNAGAMDFSSSASPTALSAGLASTATTTATVTATSGCGDAVDLSVLGLPTGATASFSPASVAGSGTSQLTVTVVVAQPGTYTLLVTGKSGWRTHSTQVTLTVSLSAPPVPPLPGPTPPALPVVPGLPPPLP